MNWVGKRERCLLLFLSCFFMVWGAGILGPAPVSAQSDAAPSEVVIETQLVVAGANSGGPTSRPTSQPAATSRPAAPPKSLANVTVGLLLKSPDGRDGRVEAKTDADGKIKVSLGAWAPGSSVRVVAKDLEGQSYVARMQYVGQPVAQPLTVYPIDYNREGLHHALMVRVVTEVPGDEYPVRVRQIQTFGHTKDHAYFGTAEQVEPITAVIPVPPGGKLLSAEFDGRQIKELDQLADHPEWGHGLPLRQPLFPGSRVVSVYAVPAELGTSVEFGFRAPISTQSFGLAVEDQAFVYLPGESDSRVPLMDAGEPTKLPNTEQLCKPWQNAGIPADTEVTYKARYLGTASDGRLQTLPFSLQVHLYDGTRYYQTGGQGGGAHGQGNPHGTGKTGEVRALALCDVEIELLDVNGKTEVVQAATNDRGLVEVSLGERLRGSTVNLTTKFEGREYRAIPMTVGGTIQPMQLLFRAAADAGSFTQEIMRVVTEQQGSTGEMQVHVRQIMYVNNPRFEVLGARSRDEAPSFVFPMPEGAKLISLTMDGQAVPTVPPVTDPTWGYGVPLRTSLLPQFQMMGTYQIAAREGDEIDLSFKSPIRTARLFLALERARFQYEPGEAGKEASLQDAGQQQAPGTSKQVQQWASDEIEPNAALAISVRYGKPEVKTRTWMISLLILVVIVVGALGGLVLAKAGRGRTSQTASLEERLASGEISAEEFAELQGTAAPAAVAPAAAAPAPVATQAAPLPADVRQRLQDIVSRTDRSPEQFASDFDELKKAVQQHLLSESKELSGS